MAWGITKLFLKAAIYWRQSKPKSSWCWTWCYEHMFILSATWLCSGLCTGVTKHRRHHSLVSFKHWSRLKSAFMDQICHCRSTRLYAFKDATKFFYYVLVFNKKILKLWIVPKLEKKKNYLKNNVSSSPTFAFFSI